MSIKYIKSALEQHLSANETVRAIKWSNSNVYTVDNEVLSQSEIDDLQEFIAPIIIPISEDMELIGGSESFRYELFFQISVLSKLNQGTGELYETVDSITHLFKNKTIDNVVISKTETLTSFTEGEWLITPVRIKCHFWGV